MNYWVKGGKRNDEGRNYFNFRRKEFSSSEVELIDVELLETKKPSWLKEVIKSQ